jgi:class 3 adenylate cyclase
MRPAAAERRQLTLLFCDLVDSTRLANILELEELRDVVRSYQAACADCVRRYGGTISRFMGDGILVLFGYPHAHEDDPERAGRAGLAMVEAVARLPPPSAVTPPLAVRVGIATGAESFQPVRSEVFAQETSPEQSSRS